MRKKEAIMRDHIEVRGARVHLGKITAIAGVSGSGKSSLALGVLYAEGSRRYLESLSTYTRRRMTTAGKADADEVLYVPAALALRQRPGAGGIRSTFGTGTELLNSLRLMYSRLASHRCPRGHYLPPSLAVAAGQPLTCPVCGEEFYAPSAEELAFNSQGACRACGGTGVVRTVDRDSLIPDETGSSRRKKKPSSTTARRRRNTFSTGRKIPTRPPNSTSPITVPCAPWKMLSRR